MDLDPLSRLFFNGLDSGKSCVHPQNDFRILAKDGQNDTGVVLTILVVGVEMKYRIVAVGKIKRSFLQAGCAHFLERLGPYAKVEMLELKEGRGSPQRIKEQEGAALLSATAGYKIALDEHGFEHSSASFAARIGELETRSISQLSFLLGGANGHSEALKAQADELWSLSKLTLPHELARLVLLEQMYRAETIRAGHPYHRAG